MPFILFESTFENKSHSNMDPDYKSTCDKSGVLEIPDCGKIYYELRGILNTENICLIMGAFATLRHYDELADFLASKGFRVLTYDHRGIGRSIALKPSERQTSSMLARDCVCLINEVFGRDSPVHLYGASMGGCVAQHAAIYLSSEDRLLSLYLAVTSPGSYVRIALPQSIWKFLVSQFLIKKDPRVMIEDLVPKCFDKEFLAEIDESGRSMQERWTEKWTMEFKEWFSFHDKVASASQCSVFANHYISSGKLQSLVRKELPITVHIADMDQLVPPAKQRQLGDVLKARIITFHGGHMGGAKEKIKFFNGILTHLHPK